MATAAGSPTSRANVEEPRNTQDNETRRESAGNASGLRGRRPESAAYWACGEGRAALPQAQTSRKGGTRR